MSRVPPLLVTESLYKINISSLNMIKDTSYRISFLVGCFDYELNYFNRYEGIHMFPVSSWVSFTLFLSRDMCISYRLNYWIWWHKVVYEIALIFLYYLYHLQWYPLWLMIFISFFFFLVCLGLGVYQFYYNFQRASFYVFITVYFMEFYSLLFPCFYLPCI